MAAVGKLATPLKSYWSRRVSTKLLSVLVLVLVPMQADKSIIYFLLLEVTISFFILQPKREPRNIITFLPYTLI